jgi:hypothetical protein
MFCYDVDSIRKEYFAKVDIYESCSAIKKYVNISILFFMLEFFYSP